ncbi:winged helix-turn-helix domain-containing protein [Aminipila luticellarii]|uniref:Stage 0 sporulation protein A homolog n=1 Tax=Aminipila luticellarii TaxID=2507160 RepID=A0A410PUX6_9FIRM|nr:response regulator transcription factor [Aminipila luticellarii]QAT42714.1 response regulator transcription factor [Aminipila luticellarii]
MKKILIIEDEPNIIELVGYNLKTNGYNYISAEDGIMGITLVHKEKPDLILLDLMLPGKNGHEICRELREDGNKTPIIMLTAKSDEVDKILGLEFGADDYITKPFSVRELMARIKAVLRRYEENNSPEKTNDYIIRIDDIEINTDRHEVTVAGKLVELTLKEFELLCFLTENRGHVFSRNQLLDKVWGIDYVGETRTVDVHIRYLRKKLGQDDNEDKYIQTIRGKGYKMK